MSKSNEVTRYCYTRQQIETMIGLSANSPELRWLIYVMVGLATTGLRISELAGLRWSDIDLTKNTITLPDNSRRGPRKQRSKARSTKGG